MASTLEHCLMNLSPTTALLLFISPLVLILAVIHHKRAAAAATTSKKKSPLPPSPPGLPFIGNLHQLAPLPHRSLAALSAQHGPLMLLRLGQVPVLVASSPDAAQEMMRTHDAVFASRPHSKVVDALFYDGLNIGFAPYGDYWRQARKLCVTHLLSSRMVHSHSFKLARDEEVRSMLAKVEGQSSTAAAARVVDMSRVLNSFTNDIIFRAVSGSDCIDGRSQLFKEIIDEITAVLGGFQIGDYFPRLAWLDALSGVDKKVWRSWKRWDEVLGALLREHAAGRLKEGQERGSFIDVLLSLQKDRSTSFDLTDDHIKALLMDIISAGTDPSYITLEWALAELVRNPEAMKRAQDEVRSTASGKAMAIEEDVSKMDYLRAVIKETLRLHPPVPLLLPRESMEECQVSGYRIPRGTRVLINAWAVGRDPWTWKAPEEFQPERFLDGAAPVDFRGNDFQLIPFGSGRRICPGMGFAVSNIELALANLVHRFDWDLPAGMTRDGMGMTDTPGLTCGRKERLDLVAKPRGSW